MPFHSPSPCLLFVLAAFALDTADVLADAAAFNRDIQPILAGVPKPAAALGVVRNPIDAFVLEHLAKDNLKQAPEADKARLLRRVSLDLPGLPPTPQELDAFLADAAADAYEKAVDRLLA